MSDKQQGVTQTTMQEFIANTITAKEHSKDGYVTYDEVIDVATELLAKEKQQIGDAHFDGQKCAGCKHPSGHDALAYFTQTYSQL